jgi:hypothetical protein
MVMLVAASLAGDFAEDLYERGDYEAARIEFQREAFETGDLHPAFRAGECLWQLGDFEGAADHFDAYDHPSFALAEAESRYWMGDLEASRQQLSALPFSPATDYRLSWIAVRLGEDANPPGAFGQDYAALPELRLKRPALAGTMSAVLPGSGQLYAGQPRDAASALLVNGVLIGATTALVLREQYVGASLTGVLALSFYSGNIYAAVNAAHKRNRRLQRQRLEALEEEHEMRLTVDEQLNVVPVKGQGW